MLTEDGCDGLEDALQKIADENVAPEALKPLKHIQSTGQLRNMLVQGMDISKLNNGPMMLIPATGGTIPNMAKVYWKQEIPTSALGSNDLKASGVILSITDAEELTGTPSLAEAIKIASV